MQYTTLTLDYDGPLALVTLTERLLSCSVDTTELEERAAEYERRMDDLVTEDENVAAYVAHLEEMDDSLDPEPSAGELTAEIEHFLRQHRSH